MALAAAVHAATELVQVKSNSMGGTALYRERKEELRKCLARLSICEVPDLHHAENLLAVMDRKFCAKTAGTWRPYVVCIIRALNPDEAAVAAALELARLGPGAEAAVRVAEEEGRLSKRGQATLIDRKRPLALVTTSDTKRDESGEPGSSKQLKLNQLWQRAPSAKLNDVSTNNAGESQVSGVHDVHKLDSSRIKQETAVSRFACKDEGVPSANDSIDMDEDGDVDDDTVQRFFAEHASIFETCTPPDELGSVAQSVENPDCPHDKLAGLAEWMRIAVVEKFCQEKLKAGKVTAAIVWKALGFLPVPQRKTRQNIRQEGTEYIQTRILGLYAYADSVGVTTATKEMPKFTELLTRYMTQEHKEFAFSSIVVNINVESAPHVDKNNLGLSKIIAFGDYSGGQLWVHKDGGTHPHKLQKFPQHHSYKAGHTYVGCKLNVKKQWQDFDGNFLHFTMPFKGTRISIIYYCIDRYQQAKLDVRDDLQRVGFPNLWQMQKLSGSTLSKRCRMGGA